MRALLLLIPILCAAGCDGVDIETTTSSTEQATGDSWGSGPKVLPVEGDLRTHDPALIQHGSTWYVFSTGDPAVAGGTIQIRKSHDLIHWSYAGNVFTAIPAWATAAVPAVTNLWAPDIIKRSGKYYLYYSVSSFGSNRSAIGLATNVTLDPTSPAYQWVDQGMVTSTGPANDYNAIDPAIIDDDGTPYMALGSFWSGIRMFRLEWPSGKLVAGQGEPLRLADRWVPPNAVEAASIVKRHGYFYLFVSLDFCCRGVGSTYKIAVGRSEEVTGPYYDQLGTPLQHGGGTVILSENGTMFGPGGAQASTSRLTYHWYDAEHDGDFRLGIRTIVWDDGWPVVAAATDEHF
jgi:arabinan endo-1,5-alpha-L-arabinosidase